MASVQGYLVDTNVLLRLSRLGDPRQQVVKNAINELNSRGVGLYFALQSIAEFWNVCTRPTERNGFGLSIGETSQSVEQLERAMTFLPILAASIPSGGSSSSLTMCVECRSMMRALLPSCRSMASPTS